LPDAFERASPNTWWPAPINSCTMAVPMKPVAPVINTRIIDLILVDTNILHPLNRFIQICFDLAEIVINNFNIAKTGDQVETLGDTVHRYNIMSLKERN